MAAHPGDGQAPPRFSATCLEAAPRAAALARSFARQVMREWGADTRAKDVALVVSELVTNAVNAARPITGGSVIGLQLRLAAAGLYAEVWDEVPGDPAAQDAGPDAEGGRGLLITAAISKAWGVARPPLAARSSGRSWPCPPHLWRCPAKRAVAGDLRPH